MDASKLPQYPPAPVFPVEPSAPHTPGCVPPFPSQPLELRESFAVPFSVNASACSAPLNVQTFNVTSQVSATAPCFPAFVPSSNNGGH